MCFHGPLFKDISFQFQYGQPVHLRRWQLSRPSCQRCSSPHFQRSQSYYEKTKAQLEVLVYKLCPSPTEDVALPLSPGGGLGDDSVESGEN